jgi:hypothetical protein
MTMRLYRWRERVCNETLTIRRGYRVEESGKKRWNKIVSHLKLIAEYFSKLFKLNKN